MACNITNSINPMTDNKKPKDPNIIRLNFAKRQGLIDDEQHARILQYLESDEDDVRDLGATTLKGIIQKSSM